jgi:hypothetical protein
MTQERKPVFGFLWPEHSGPVDADFHQVRRSRVTGRGPWRVVGLSVLSAGTVAVLGAALMAALSTGISLGSAVGAALAATLLLLTLRAWVVGTYVTDAGLSVERTWRRTSVPWDEVDAVVEEEGHQPLLGSPVPVPGQRCFVVLTDGTRLPTHVYTSSPDLWLRPEAYDMARLRLDRWRTR